MKVLVTGAAGFVGTHLVPALRDAGHEVLATSHTESPGCEVLDVTRHDEVDRVISTFLPERIFNLAGQAGVARSWKDPGLTFTVNVAGPHHILEAVRRFCPSCRVHLPCTSDGYGIVAPEDCPLEEDAPLRPASPYAMSKVTQEWVGRMFVEAFGLHVVVTRAFMHIGPGQPPSFATGDWARQIALAEAGKGPREVSIGNIEVARELGDVRDVVRAYIAALENGPPGSVFNVATGDARPLREPLEILLSLATVPMTPRADPAKQRPTELPVLEGSAAALERLTGWKPERHIHETLADVLEWWRNEVRNA